MKCQYQYHRFICWSWNNFEHGKCFFVCEHPSNLHLDATLNTKYEKSESQSADVCASL